MREQSRRITLALAGFALLFGAAPISSYGQQETAPAPTAPRSVQLPKPFETTLKNGLRVIVAKRPGSSLVSATLLVRNGGEVDPGGLDGLANLTATLLTEGTTTRTAPQIAEQIEALGGTVNSGARWDAATAGINIMSSKFDQAMEILADVVTNPAFKDDEIDRQRQQILDNLRVQLRQPGALARFVASRVVFGDSPYGHMLAGTPESIARIRRDDIVKLHATYYRPDNAVLVIGGDIDPQAAVKIAEKWFGAWKKPMLALPKATSSVMKMAETSGRVIVIDKADAGQAAVLLARPGLHRTDPEYYRGMVMNSVLGGGYSARLNQEIRIKRGLSYGAGSQFDVRRNAGAFMASAQTKNESGAEVASLLIGELSRLASEPVSDAELTPRKAVLIGGFGRSLESTGGLVGQFNSLALYGISLSEINSYISNVQAVSAVDVQKFAGSRLNAKEASIIIVGNGKEFLDALKKQFPNVEVIKESELDLNSPTLRKKAPAN